MEGRRGARVRAAAAGGCHAVELLAVEEGSVRGVRRGGEGCGCGVRRVGEGSAPAVAHVSRRMDPCGASSMTGRDRD